MSARASLATARITDQSGRTATRITNLRSKAPLVLRPTHPKEQEPWVHQSPDAARVALASGAAGPLGGDEFALNIRVGAGSTLVLNEISATLLLPGARGGRSRMRIAVHVENDATFLWLAEPVIAAHGCDHVHDIDIGLAPRARMLIRDELLLGRHREPPGNLTQNIRIRRNNAPLFNQQLRLGSAARGWASPAVLGDNKCIGTVLAVDPTWLDGTPETHLFAAAAALLPLSGPAVMISALAPRTLELRRLLNQGLALVDDLPTPDPMAVDKKPLDTGQSVTI